MISTIDLNDNFEFKIYKISYVITNNMLPSEFEVKVISFEKIPQNTFSIRRKLSVFFCKFQQKRNIFISSFINIHDILYLEGIAPPFGGVGGGQLPLLSEGLGRPLYILSGTSIPRRDIPFFRIFATLRAMVRRICLLSSVSAPRML